MFTANGSNEGSTPQPLLPPVPVATSATESPVENRSPRRSPGRRRLAVAGVAVLTIAGGTAGGAFAGARADKPTVATPVPTAVQTATATPVALAKVDASALIDAALPSVVSITVQLEGGQGAGTGFVISADGQIATNAHVVADATSIQIGFGDGSSAVATVLGVDRTADLAVIKVAKSGLIPLPLGTSADLKMGEPVVAIGNALDLTGAPTATEGIVSALDRTIDTQEGEHLTHLIQTDAAINPGNSGGPLLTLDGKVVGINSLGSQDAQNIGFAIAIDTALPIIAQLQQGKAIANAFLGVSVTPIDATVAARYGLDVDHGLLIINVGNGTPAATAGLQAGDVIISFNGTTTDDTATLSELIRTTGAGNVAHILVRRNGTTSRVDATLSTQAT